VVAGEMSSHAVGTSNGGSGDAAAGGAARRNTRMPKCEISCRIYPVCGRFSCFFLAKARDGAIIYAGLVEMLLAYALFGR
jgi:hypothetical protein